MQNPIQTQDNQPSLKCRRERRLAPGSEPRPSPRPRHSSGTSPEELTTQPDSKTEVSIKPPYLDDAGPGLPVQACQRFVHEEHARASNLRGADKMVSDKGADPCGRECGPGQSGQQMGPGAPHELNCQRQPALVAAAQLFRPGVIRYPLPRTGS